MRKLFTVALVAALSIPASSSIATPRQDDPGNPGPLIPPGSCVISIVHDVRTGCTWAYFCDGTYTGACP